MPRVHSRPWIRVISSGHEPDLHFYAERLFSLGVRRVSAVGGRKLATSLIDARLVSDLYVTTSPLEGGRPDSPMYEGTGSLSRDLVVRKQTSGGVVFEHFIIGAGPQASSPDLA